MKFPKGYDARLGVATGKIVDLPAIGLQIALVMAICALFAYEWPQNLGFPATTVEEVDQTGRCELFCYESDINWVKQACYPGCDVQVELNATQMQEILDFLPGLKGRRVLPFEWRPWNGVNCEYPDPMELRVAYGGRIDAHWRFEVSVVQKNEGYIAFLHHRGPEWYRLIDADAFIQSLLQYYPERGKWIPRVPDPNYHRYTGGGSHTNR